jgi:predicted ATPase/DNA-binding SARP family transcriptional activator
MRFGILGTTQVWRTDGAEVSLGGPGRRALLALLLVRPGEVVSVDRLVDELYGTAAGATHALQSQVFRLRNVLRDDVVERLPAGYRLVVKPDDVDSGRFERLCAEGRRALASGDAGRAADLLRTALALWRGPALVDVPDCAWARVRADELAEQRLDALEDRAEADLRLGAHRTIVPELRRLVEQHPLRERLSGLLMRALRADGRPAEALTVFADLRRLLADELGTDPSAELVDLHQTLLRNEHPARTRRPPAQLTGLVGRDDDLARVAELVASARLVSLVGPGGVGKTRLSVEVTRDLPDVCFVELAAIGQEELPGAVLHALGLRETARYAHSPPTAPEDRLTEALADRPLLLLLDNCEHLVDAVAVLVAKLVGTCPALRILATSREPLRITGERLWPVRPLAEDAAVRLFVDRAAAVRPNLVLEGETTRQICATLDGLPLAIELAAARLRTLEPARLATGLRDRFETLSRGSRVSPPRHQTLRAAVAWSWALLSPVEQEAASRFAVFAGSAELAGAQRVCAVANVADVLESLTDKSLLEVDGGRYRMLETIRSYCVERLTDETGTRRRHAEHLLELARTADPYLRRAEQLRWLEILDAEQDNLHAALRWAVDADHTLAVRLIGAWSPYLWMRGLRASVAPHAAAVLGDRPPDGLADEYVFCVLAAGEHRPAAAALVTEPGRTHHPMILFLWSMIHPESAEELVRSAAGSTRPWEAALGHLLSGYPRLLEGGHAAAEAEFSAAAEGFRALGDRWAMTLALGSAAGLANLRGDPASAVVLVEEALTYAEELGATEDFCDLLCERADYRVRLGAVADAHADYRRAEQVARDAGLPTYQAAGLRGLGDVARLTGDLVAAGRFYEQALARFQARWLRSVANRAAALLGLGHIAETTGDLARSRARYVQALEVTVTAGTLPEGARAVEALAGIEGDPTSAARLLGAATALRGTELPAEAAASTRAALGDEAFEAAYADGVNLSPAAALRLAGVSEAVLADSPVI